MRQTKASSVPDGATGAHRSLITPSATQALSRGARFALFVDNGAEARAVLRANVETLALGGVTRMRNVPAQSTPGMEFRIAAAGPELRRS